MIYIIYSTRYFGLYLEFLQIIFNQKLLFFNFLFVVEFSFKNDEIRGSLQGYTKKDKPDQGNIFA
jgi:hypothetical protein